MINRRTFLGALVGNISGNAALDVKGTPQSQSETTVQSLEDRSKPCSSFTIRYCMLSCPF